EPLPDLLLGKVDAFEIDSFEDSPFDAINLWHTLLQAGLRIPLVGGSGKESNGKVLGVFRTYARLSPDEELGYTNWIEAVRAGRTFVTNGPLLQFHLDGQGAGTTLDLTEPRTVHVHADARSAVPFEHLEVLVNGEVVAAAAGAGAPCAAVVERDVLIETSGWIAARCRGIEMIPDQ